MDKIKGLDIKKNENGFTAIRLHYSADPDKDPDTIKGQVWFRDVMKGKSEQDIQQEYEVNFAVFRGKRVYPKFSLNIHVFDKLKPIKDVGFPMLVGLDFGYHHPAMIMTQYDGHSLRLIDEWMPKDVNNKRFAQGILHIMSYYIADGFKVRYYSGTEAKTPHQDTGLTSQQILGNLGIGVVVFDSPINDGLHIIRNLLNVGEDGVPRLICNNKNNMTIDAFMGGYHYKEEVSGKELDEKPHKDGIYEHIMDALRYLVIASFDLEGNYFYTEEEEELIDERLMFINPKAPRRIINPYGNTRRRPQCPSTGY